MKDDFNRGYNAHVAWEVLRGEENECDVEKQIRENQAYCNVDWWLGWVSRSDEWRKIIGI